MKITVNRKALLKAMDINASVLTGKVLIPSYNYFMFDVQGEKCFIKSRNSHMQAKTFVPVETDEDFKFCIPGSKAVETIRLIDAEEVILTTKKSDNDVYTTTITVKGKKNRYKNTGIDPESFAHMKVDEITETPVDMEDLTRALSKASVPTDSNNLMTMLSGINVSTEDNLLKIIGANNNYMHRSVMKVDKPIPDMTIPKSIATALSLLPISPKSNIGTDGRNIQFTCGSVQLTGILIDGKYPDTDQFFSRLDKDKYINISRQDLIKAMKVLRLYSSKESRSMDLEVSGDDLLISAESEDKSSSAKEVVGVEISGVDDGFSMCLNPIFVLTAIEKIETDVVRIHIVSDDYFVFLTENTEESEDYWLIAPIRSSK